MEKDNTVYLRHVLDAINTIEEYLQGVNEDHFKATRLLQDGAIDKLRSSVKLSGIFPKTSAKHILRSPVRIWLE